MGWLDHSTNNIILDCVLTDTGRAFLARNDGSFNIVKFAVSDEEVDYTIISKFGRTVGKEKIEKNTPVFEALTNPTQAQKFRAISISNPNLIRLPNITLSGEGVDSTASVVSMARTGSGSSRRVTLSQLITNENSIDVELRDQVFVVKMNNLFLQVPSSSPTSTDKDSTSTYLLTRDATTTSAGGSILTLDLAVKSLTDVQFTVYGNVSNKTIITSTVRVTGLQSGATNEFNVQISK